MTTPTSGTLRWKLACAMFAGIAGYATVSAYDREPANKPAVGVAVPRGAGLPGHFKRPLRISAEAAGISRDELIDRALSARSLRDLVAITGMLGTVGNDHTVDQLRPLLDRVASISSLALGFMDDPRASVQLAALIRDPDPTVAQTAIYSSSNAGPEVDVALTYVLNDPNATEAMKSTAASQLRTRGTELDDATENKVAAIVGQLYGSTSDGGGGYGGYGDHGDYAH